MSATQLDDSYLILSFFNRRYASSKMRACQISNELKKKYKYVLNNPNINSFNNENRSLLKKKKVVFLYKFAHVPRNYKNILRNAFVIWDIIDGLAGRINDKNNKFFRRHYKESHLINCANSGQMNMLKKYNPSNRIFDCIPHNWDNRVRNCANKAKENENLEAPKFVFLGTPQKGGYDHRFMNYKDFNRIGKMIVNDKNNTVGTFNVCGSFRPATIAMGKPGTKCAVAASLNCVFLANKKEYGVYDLLGDDYPYYFEEPISEKVIDKSIDYIKKTYKTEIWDKAMECVKKAKEKSDVINVTNDFIRHFENYFLNLNKKNIVFTAPNVEKSYNFIFKKDPRPRKIKVLKITTVDENSKKFVSTYKENTPKIYIQPNHTIESVYYGLRHNMIEVTDIFKQYISNESHGIIE